MLELPPFTSRSKQIANEGAEPVELVRVVDIVLDHIEHEVVPAAERPQCDRQKPRDLPAGISREQAGGGKQAEEKKKPALEEDRAAVAEVIGETHHKGDGIRVLGC